MMGWEGVFGMTFTTLIIIPVQFLGCPMDEENCSNGKIDDISQAFEQMNGNIHMYVFILFFMLASAGNGGFGS